MQPYDPDWESLFHANHLPVAVLDRELIVVACNKAYEMFCGVTDGRVVGHAFYTDFPCDESGHCALQDSFNNVWQSGQVHCADFLDSGVDGQSHTLTIVNTPVFSQIGELCHVLFQAVSKDNVVVFRQGVVSRFISLATPGSTAELASALPTEPDVGDCLADERQRINFLFKQAPSFICILKGPNHVYEFANDAYYQLVGHREIIGHELAMVLPEVVPQGFLDKLDRVYNTGVPFIGRALPIDLQRSIGAPLEQTYIDLMYQPIRGDQGKITGIFVQGHDVSEAHRLSQLVTHQATHDPLTGLANRRLLEEFSPALEASSDSHILLYLDLDHFKVINDRCGHGAGDKLLIQIAGALKSIIGPKDFLARIGGDEFVLVLSQSDVAEGLEMAHQLRSIVKALEFVWDGRRYGVTLSVGVSTIGGDGGARFSDALSLADSACFLAKEKGRNRVQVGQFDDEEICRQKRDMDWATRIKEAIADDRILLWAQQIVPLAERTDGTFAHHGKPVEQSCKPSQCFEVLARFIDTNGEVIPPGAFISAAERFGLVEELDGHIVKKVFEVLESDLFLNKNALLFVNLSGVTLSRPDFPGIVFATMKRHPGVSPCQVCFEITETAAITHLGQASETMGVLVEMGFSFALDDFGSGMSSFGYLGRLPVSYVKIDGDFVRSVDATVAGAAIVEAVTKVAKAMKIVTIAEHVERNELVPRLKELGVDMGQGYALHRPEPIALLHSKLG